MGGIYTKERVQNIKIIIFNIDYIECRQGEGLEVRQRDDDQ